MSISCNYQLHLNSTGDLQNDGNPEFAKQFYLALSVVCDDLFFARYRRDSSTAKTLADQSGASVDKAASSLFAAMFGNAQTEPEKHSMVEELLDTRLLHSTDSEGVHFNKERCEDRSVYDE